MGYALADEAARRGHHVILVSGPVELPAPAQVEFAPVVTGQEMLEACRRHFDTCDAALMCAAVCDYRPVTRTAGKAPKTTQPHSVILEPAEDICATLGDMKGSRIVIGFALETHEAHARAQAKLQRKNCDLIVLNHPAGIGEDETTVEVFSRVEGWASPRSGLKTEIAAYLIDVLEQM